MTTIDRCRDCGWSTIGAGVTVKLGMTEDGVPMAGFGGVETCGRIWLCPVCAAKIRLRRGDEIARGVARYLEADGAVYFLTATLPHEHTDALACSFDVLARTWRYVTDSRAWKRAREVHGLTGTIKAVEVTHGANGWHPHIHVILLGVPVSFDERMALWADLDAVWARGLVKHGWSAGRAPYRLRLDGVQLGGGDGRHLAAYVAKVQDRGIGNEMARADLKVGRKESRTPFEILADFGDGARADDLELWWEYEHATRGRSAIRWSPGLRARLLPDEKEQSDEEIAAEDMGGEVIAHLTAELWARLRRTDDAVADVLDSVERMGWEGLVRTLIRYRIGRAGLYTPDEWQSPGTVHLEDV